MLEVKLQRRNKITAEFKTTNSVGLCLFSSARAPRFCSATRVVWNASAQTDGLALNLSAGHDAVAAHHFKH